jgi:5-formyltetrahydrofolate cyclo-ligase
MSAKSVGNKADLRKELRAKRRAISPDEHALRSAQAAKAITRLPQFSAGRRVALTLSFDGEIATAALIAAARKRGVCIFSPVVVDRRHRIVRFYPLTAHTRRGAFGILVPRRTVYPVLPRWFDLIIVPLVGIDPAGRRLGMGGGFYDRAMAFRRLRKYWRGPRLVGFAFDCQRAESVHAQHWDLRLDALATESGLRHYPQGPT